MFVHDKEFMYWFNKVLKYPAIRYTPVRNTQRNGHSRLEMTIPFHGCTLMVHGNSRMDCVGKLRAITHRLICAESEDVEDDA